MAQLEILIEEKKNEKEQSVTVVVLNTVLHVSKHSEFFFKELFHMKVSLPLKYEQEMCYQGILEDFL